ncbi:5'-nucleotidase/2',3'-cyclic phosphodiesterase-like hydrolase [Belliella baltica DSM 15883]|uniref:5'-nucleotidase/2',3'-cyclic phosphodiesterase-like hydrolase n=1 Tax=Belliella baltica (strain DSM 15883 / CIP 108006 / LMG 21964 / BA134) TaxID=866536 RepID=I3ZAT4_BELBD|nr:metallophosphatase [Belliella baltica]AFL86352.1 5'-nucleotidase/2',3'-cyclic phosphodiesterase-like hydrolase [Belliella baltica DSM 15883]
MQRRDFLKKSLLTGAALSLSSGGFAERLFTNQSKRLTILHTNDMHSRIEPFPNDGGRNANRGGMTKLASLIKKIRSEEENVLLLDSGDFFQGTPYFNLYGGELELKLMSQMGYDASTLGNHEFDNGLEGIKNQLEHANFSILSSNYDFQDTILNNTFKPYKIFKKDGIKVGIFALGIELKGLVGMKNYGNTKYLDPIATSEEMVQELKNKKCDLIICLSHLGYSYRSGKIDDLKLANQVSGIDLILGGHTHTFLDEPTIIKNPEGHTTMVNQVGTAALRLGKIDFEFSKDNQISYASHRNLTIY